LIDDVIKAWNGQGAKMKMILKKEVYKRAIGMVMGEGGMKSHYALADMRYPMEWYPTARSIKRTIHLHVGPTNSGKTYNALKRLREATGPSLYAGPLRMLAQEIYQRLNAQGKATWLLTGDDRRDPTAEWENREEYTISCTVEMIPLTAVIYDVAVIDEIQMLANRERGAHWTAALLGVAAKEVHLCGEERAVDIVRQIVSSLGEELVIHRYERLSPLEVMKVPIKSLNHLEKGDCIVAFSVAAIHKIRRKVESITGKRCAVVYGSLPAEVRAQQAKWFNDPDNDYDFLVASDAIGMGLNL
jgi:ATP-dependent RNA helicase SUPV3L1/SUV3